MPRIILPAFVRRLAGLLIAVLIALIAGCAAQVHMDSINLRDRAVAYYNEEVMDNLIRGKNGYPILHVDITTLQSDVKNQLQASLGGGQTFQDTGSLQTTHQAVGTLSNSSASSASTAVATTVGNMLATTLSTVANVGRVVMRPETFTVTPQSIDELQLQAQPKTNDSTYYLPYIQFLNLDTANMKPGKDPTSLTSGVLGSLTIPSPEQIKSACADRYDSFDWPHLITMAHTRSVTMFLEH